MNRTTTFIALALAGLTGCGMSHGNSPQKTLPTIYILDSGQTGWVKVVYNSPGEKELPVQNGFVVAHFGQDLKLFTRSRMNPSWDEAQFYYQTTDGKRVRLSSADNASRRIWALEKTTDVQGERETFFVGSQDELSATLKTPRSAAGGHFHDLAQPAEPENKDPLSDPTKVLTDLPKQ